jgi:hypothetical protein
MALTDDSRGVRGPWRRSLSLHVYVNSSVIMQIETVMRFLLGWLLSKGQKTSVDETWRIGTVLAGGDVKWCGCCGRQFGR